MTSTNFPKFYLLFELTQLRFIPYIFSLIWMGNNRTVKIAGGKSPDGKSREGNVRVGNDWAAERLDPCIISYAPHRSKVQEDVLLQRMQVRKTEGRERL